MFRRLIFVARMMFATLFYWGPVKWIKFWMGSRHDVTLDGMDMTVRDASYFSKIADLAMAWEVVVDHVYDYYPIAEDDTILDIGGHIGSFSKRAAMKAHKGQVHVCEPFPPTHKMLKHNVAPLSNVTTHTIAISNRDGTDTFYYSEKNPAENSLVRKTETSTEVPLMTLSNFLAANNLDSIDLMKIDCEGAEYDIIHAPGDHLKKIKKMVMEIHEPKFFGLADKYSIDGIVAHLEDNGFETKFVRENKYQGYIYAHQRTA